MACEIIGGYPNIRSRLLAAAAIWDAMPPLAAAALTLW